MLGWLSGTVVHTQGNTLILDVAGVGYEVSVPTNVLESLTVGAPLALFIHHARREDGDYLYGFLQFDDRRLFRECIKVSGIGPKLALLILSGFSKDELIHIIHEQNVTALTKVPGIGKKIAERLLLDLKDRISKQFALSTAVGEAKPLNSSAQEALEALLALELKLADAQKLVDTALALHPQADTATLVKEALALKLKGKL